MTETIITDNSENQATRALKGALFKNVVEKALRDLGITGATGIVVVASFPDGSACQIPAGAMTIAGYCFMAQQGAATLAAECEDALNRARSMQLHAASPLRRN